MLGRIAKVMCDLYPTPCDGVVAVSGGPDSIALARILVELQCQKLVGQLVLVHINHQLRGQESDADEAFVASFAQKLSRNGARVSFQSERVDAATEAQRLGENLENVAREIRYTTLTRIAQEEGAPWVATGHTADDQAETVLYRLLRGSGLHGLTGIPIRRALADRVEVVRPLLHEGRADILGFLEEIGQAFRHDSSNETSAYTRNRIRNGLLPQLGQEYNPAIVSLLCRLAEQAGEVQTWIAEEAERLCAAAEMPRAGELLIFDVTCLKKARTHLVREMFRFVWQREGWPARHMGFEDWSRLTELLADGSSAMDLPGGIRARRREKVIQIGPRAAR